jgi:hypothetical protein
MSIPLTKSFFTVPARAAIRKTNHKWNMNTAAIEELLPAKQRTVVA